jgi:TIR domain
VLLFLSYADADSEIAREIAERLSKEDISVYSPQDRADHGGLATAEPDLAIQQADAFVALLSPDFLTSTSCRMERDLALSREYRGRANGMAGDFVQVLKIREMAHLHAPALQSRIWFDLTAEGAWDRVLNDLASKFDSSDAQPLADPLPPGGNGGQPRTPSPRFRNREKDVDDIYTGITSEDGQHFWVVIAPPKLGKSWLLDHIADKVYRSWHHHWTVRLVDARELDADIVDDADAIVRLMFGLSPEAGTGWPVASTITASMRRDNRSFLCLLDSAELLEDSTVRALRQQLHEIDLRLSEGGGAGPQLAVVAASRRESEWTGVSPKPRLQVRRLTEFRVEVIQESLQHLARDMDARHVRAELPRIAQRVHALSEGLPALLAGCLQWIREHEWNDLERLEDTATFEEIARPYIEKDLLSANSLSARGTVPNDDERAAIQDALLMLSPYRFLTMSHLSRHLGAGTLQHQLNRLNWGVTDLWNALSGADLLYLPLAQPWHEVYAPIRRLLCRHAYPAVADRAQAHRDAGVFMRSFMVGLYGSDQCRALVECLWQEARARSLTRSADLEEALVRLAGELSRCVVPVRGIEVDALRDLAGRFVNSDQELADAVEGIRGLLDGLVEAVRQPT